MRKRFSAPIGLSDLLGGSHSINALPATYCVSAAAVARAAAKQAGPLPQYWNDSWHTDKGSQSWEWRLPPLLPAVHCEEAKGVPESYEAGAHLSPDEIDTWQEQKAPWSVTNSGWRPIAPKVYKVKLKPLVAVLYPRPLLMTAVRSLLLNFMPLVEEYIERAKEDLEENEGDVPLPPVPNLVEPAKKSVWTGLREITVVTTRRVLERIIIHYVTPRVACKLIKDYYDSALRKWERGFRGGELFSRMCATTFRSHLLSIAAQWLVQLSIDSCRAGRRVYVARSHWSKSPEKLVGQLRQEAFWLSKRALGTALRGGGALVGASLGAATGTLILPGTGTWVGFVLGDLAGPTVLLIAELWS